MKPGPAVFAVLLSALLLGLGEAVAQSLPPTVDPGVQRDRLLNRDSLPSEPGPAVLQAIDCARDGPVPRGSFTLKGVRLDSAVATEKVDAKARWQSYLGEEVTLERICEIALALAADYARVSDQVVSAILPAQYIDGGVIRIVFTTE